MDAQNEPFIAADYLEIADLFTAVEALRGKHMLLSEVEADITGFRLIPGESKEELVNVPFLVVSATRRNNLGHDSHYVDVMLVTADDKRIWLRDSSKGISEQFAYMFEVTKSECVTGVWVRRGLRYEDRPFTKPNGDTVLSRTYYMKGIIPRYLDRDE